MERYGFIYIWFDRKHKRYYLGSHWGTIDDGYICSSKWMRKAYRRRPDDFRRRIIQRVTDRNRLIIVENQWLSLMKKDELRKRYYNCLNYAPISPTQLGIPITEKTRKKRSEYWKEHWKTHPNPNKGVPMSEEQKKKISAANKISQSSERNSQRGTFWITNGMDNIKVRDTTIPPGFWKGRTFDPNPYHERNRLK